MGLGSFIKKAFKSVRKIVTAPFKAVKRLIGGSSRKSPSGKVTFKTRKAFAGREFLNKLIPRSATSRGTRRPLNLSRLSRVKRGVKKAKGLSKGKKGSPSFARNRQEKKEVYTRRSSPFFKSRNKSTPVKSVSRKSRSLMKRGSRLFKRSEVSRNEGKLNRANRQSSRALRIQSRARGTDSVKK